MAFRPLPDYPQPFGTRKICIGTYEGPLSYQAGGDLFTASQVGFSSIDAVVGGATFNANNTGNLVVRALYPVGQSPAVANNNLVGAIPTGSANVNLQFSAANGTETANNTVLTSEFCRLIIYGG